MNTKPIVCKSFACMVLALFASALVPKAVPAQQHGGLKGGSGPVQLAFIPPKERRKFNKNLKWELYEAYQVLVTRTGTSDMWFEEDPATVLLLKSSGLSVDFHGQKLGPGGLEPTDGDVKSLAHEQLKHKSSKEFQVAAGGDNKADPAVIIVPKWVEPTLTAAEGGVLSFNLSDPQGRQFVEFSVSPVR